MTLRNRTLVGAAALVLTPLLVLAIAIRREMAGRLEEQYGARVDSLISVIESELTDRGRDLRSRLAALKSELHDDDSFRLAVEGRASRPTYLLDAAGRAMDLLGVDLLQVQDEEGRILSSGHFRNEYDRVDRELIDWLANVPEELGLLAARRARGRFFALARLDSLSLGARTLYLVGGWELDRGALASLTPDPEIVVSLLHGGEVLSSRPSFEQRLRPAGDAKRLLARLRRDGSHVVRARPLASRPGPAGDSAWLVVSHSLEPMHSILGALDRRLLFAWFLVAAGSIALAVGVSRRITRPIEELAHKTSSLDLDRLDAKFETDRRDEVGTLSRFLGEMTARLRTSATRLREAERRAAFADIARQVNHDLRNGFTPLRNVVRHLSEVARDAPAELGDVFREREATLRSGLAYLEELAANYARLSAPPPAGDCDAGEIARRVAAGHTTGEGTVDVSVEPGLPPVRADPVGLRRILENLVSNACDSVGSGPGRVEVTVARAPLESGEPGVRLVVRDEGTGVSDRDRVFDHFYTTKDGGTGLGLSIARRLVSDLGGTIEVDSEPGRGATFIVRLPVGGGEVPA